MIQALEPVLSADERNRAARFHFERHRNVYIIARSSLRILLGRELERPAAGLTLQYGPKGKPALADRPPVDFNLSHTEGLIVLAITRNCALGVDVERIHPIRDMLDLAARFFCQAETEELAALPAEDRERAFFLCWTRKEAYIKATGDGLSAPLSHFRVTLRPSDPARFVHIGEDSSPLDWKLHNLEVPEGYASAVAYRGEERVIRQSPVIPPESLLT